MYNLTFNREKINSLLRDFYILTGIRIGFCNRQGQIILVYPEDTSFFCNILREDSKADWKCKQCDRLAFTKAKKKGELYLYRCHAGLTEAIAPITFEDRLYGYLMMGQVLPAKPDEELWEEIYQNCAAYNLDFSALKKAFFNVSYLKGEQLTAAARIRSSKYIYQSQLVRIKRRPLMEQLDYLLETNLARTITRGDIADELNISQSHLSHLIKDRLNTTFTHYLRDKRMKKAKKLLQETDKQVKEIARETGYKDPNYFSRIFKKTNNMTPTAYRRKL